MSWYEIKVGLNKDEWYPVLTPIGRRKVFKEFIENKDRLDSQRWYGRPLYTVNLFLWLLWWLIFPLVNLLYLKLQDSYAYVENEKLDLETLKWIKD
jgi:hypothetical protein